MIYYGSEDYEYRFKKAYYQLPFKLGTVSIAQKTGAAILPVSLYYGKKKYLKIGEVQFVGPEDDIIEANKKLEKTIADMTLESMEEDKKLDNGRKIRI